MTILVFGGHSPIALNISNFLLESNTTIHITRNIDEEIKSVAKSNLTFIEWDYKNIENLLNLVECKTQIDKINGIVFAFRSKDKNNLNKLLDSDFTLPLMIIEYFNNKHPYLKINIVFLISESHNAIVYDQNLNYHVLNAALVQLIKWVSAQTKYSNFYINAIMLGSFITKARSKNFYERNPKLVNNLLETIPNKFMTKLQEISELTQILLKAQIDSLKGQIFHLNSGLSNFAISSTVKKILYTQSNLKP